MQWAKTFKRRHIEQEVNSVGLQKKATKTCFAFLDFVEATMVNGDPSPGVAYNDLFFYSSNRLAAGNLIDNFWPMCPKILP